MKIRVEFESSCCLLSIPVLLGIASLPFTQSLCAIGCNLTSPQKPLFSPPEIIGLLTVDLTKATLLALPLLAILSNETPHWPVVGYAFLTILQSGIAFNAALHENS